MNETNLTLTPSSENTNLWLQAIINRLSDIEHGRISLTLPNGETLHFGNGAMQASLKMHNYKPLSNFILHGDIALAESYMAGDWECSDLTTLFEIALANQSAFSLNNKGSWLFRTANRIRHLFNANSKKGSRRNIAYHYDLGNTFYRHWLDDTMTYSSALFEGEDSLEQAQLRKYHTIANMAELSAGDKVLEIGCGWGGFSQIAAEQYGCSIEGLTLSKEQLAYAQQRYQQAGIDHLASASLTDYRDAQGQYDKIVSIEMFEAVGYENWDTYFNRVKSLLKPGGTAVLQIILIEDARFDSYRKGVDFIQRYIFPGGLLPSLEALTHTLEKNRLALTDHQLFGKSYAKTCNIWRHNFQSAWDEIQPLGFDQRFKNMWEYYLSYCEAGFNAGTVDVGIFKIVNDIA